MYELHIANKNYSSWSLRPWVLMEQLRIRFHEQLTPFAAADNHAAFRRFSPTGKVPCLVDGATRVWESLAIVEYLAERHPGVWPTQALARAWARSAAAEMHAGFAELRARCSMNCGLRVRLRAQPQALQQDRDRLGELWLDGLERFGGPFLAGGEFSAVDAFYAPVAFRVQTYALVLPQAAATYAQTLLALPAMQRWYAAALAERWRESGHEAEVSAAGEWLQDLRAPV